MFTRILVGTDGSEPAGRALAAACDLAKTFEAELVLVHTPRPETVAFATGAIAGYHMVTTMPADEEVRAAAQKVLDEAKAKVSETGCPEPRTEVRRGDPGDEILALAKDIEADLIVTGRRGLGNFAGLVMGSTSQRVSHLATCAVLTVP